MRPHVGKVAGERIDYADAKKRQSDWHSPLDSAKSQTKYIRRELPDPHAWLEHGGRAIHSPKLPQALRN